MATHPKRARNVQAGGSDGANTDANGTLPEQPVAGSRLAVVFAVVTIALFMQSLDTTVVATALHTLQHGLHTSASWAGWTITVYAVGMVITLPLAARFGDMFGRRRVFLISVVTFSAASLCCGFSVDIFTLIAFRAVQAAGAAGLTPSATGIVVDHFGPSRDRALGLFGSVFQIGGMVGPVVGGVLVAFLSWRWIFFVNVPIGALLLMLGVRFIPQDRPRAEHARRRLDGKGMALLGVGALAAMVGITYLSEAGAAPRAIGGLMLALAAVALWRFSRHIARVAEPFIQPRLIRGRGFSAVNVVNILYGGALTGAMSLVPLYATNRYGFSALSSGTLLTAQAAAGAVLSVTAALVIRRTGYRIPLYVVALLGAIGMFALAVHPIGVTAYPWLIGATVLIGIGYGQAGPASRNAGIQLAPDQAGSLAALRTMGRRVGTISVVSIMTAVITQAVSPGIAQAWAYAGFGALLLLGAPIIKHVPEHRGAW